MREIELASGHLLLVDDDDYVAVTTVGRWHAHVSGHAVYARRRFRQDGRRTSILLHTFLTGLPLVDHINGNGLDNRRVNLRAATNSQNLQNSHRRTDNTSGFKGVVRDRRSGQWAVQIKVDGHRRHLGYFIDPAEGARVYDSFAAEHFGQFARLNFPLEIAS